MSFLKFFENKKKFISLVILGFITSILLFSIEKMLYFMISFILQYWFLTITAQILIHLFLIRILLLILIFPGSNYFYNRLMLLKLGIATANEFEKQINNLKATLEIVIQSFDTLHKSEFSNYLQTLLNFNDLVVSYIKNINQIELKYKSSVYQKKLLFLLNACRVNFEDGGLISFFEAIIENFDSENKVEVTKQVVEVQINKVNESLEELSKFTSDYLMKGNYISKVKNFIFNDSFGSFYNLKIDIAQKYNSEEQIILTKDGKKLDGILIKPRYRSEESSIINTESSMTGSFIKNLMIICTNKKTSYEYFVQSEKWVDFYSDNGCYVLLWNYRGYGASEGFPNFQKIKSDSLDVIDHIKKIYTWNFIGVHGISLGCIPAVYLMKKNSVNFGFIDRGFYSFKFMIEHTEYGKIMNFLMKCLLVKDEILIEDYLDSGCYKVLSSDPDDEYCKDICSLKAGISNKIITQLSLSKTFEYSENKENSRKLLKLILNDEEYERFISSIIVISNQINEILKKQREKTEFQLKTKNYDKLTEENPPHKEVPEVQQSEDEKVLQSIKQYFDKFDAAGTCILSVEKIIEKEEYINNYYNNLLIWGSYKIGNIVATEKLIIYRAVAKKISLLTQKLQKIVSNKKTKFKNEKVKDSLEMILELYKKLDSTYSKIVFKGNKFDTTLSYEEERKANLSIDMSLSGGSFYNTGGLFSYRNAEISDLYQNLNIGNLIPISSGHEGDFNEEELKIYSQHLLKANFFN